MSDNSSIEPFELNTNDESWDFYALFVSIAAIHSVFYFGTSWQIDWPLITLKIAERGSCKGLNWLSVSVRSDQTSDK